MLLPAPKRKHNECKIRQYQIKQISFSDQHDGDDARCQRSLARTSNIVSTLILWKDDAELLVGKF